MPFLNRLVGVFLLLLIAAVCLGPAAAGDEAKKATDIDAIFAKLDTNKDGRLSKDEFLQIANRFRDQDKARSQLAQTYDQLDPSMKGLTRDQFRAFIEARLKKRAQDAKKPGK